MFTKLSLMSHMHARTHTHLHIISCDESFVTFFIHHFIFIAILSPCATSNLNHIINLIFLFIIILKLLQYELFYKYTKSSMCENRTVSGRKLCSLNSWTEARGCLYYYASHQLHFYFEWHNNSLECTFFIAFLAWGELTQCLLTWFIIRVVVGLKVATRTPELQKCLLTPVAEDKNTKLIWLAWTRLITL